MKKKVTGMPGHNPEKYNPIGNLKHWAHKPNDSPKSGTKSTKVTKSVRAEGTACQGSAAKRVAREMGNIASQKRNRKGLS